MGWTVIDHQLNVKVLTMKIKRGMQALTTIALQSALLTVALGSGLNARADDRDKRDFLAVGELSDDSVRFFDQKTGQFLATPAIAPGSGGLSGVAGILFDKREHKFIVANQNTGLPFNGEVFQYDKNGAFIGKLVSKDDPDGPLAPRGISLVNNKDGSRTLFVADQGDVGVRGKLLAYKYQGPHLMKPGNLDPGTALKNPDNDGTLAAYHPRSVVLGPDGYLYVSLLGKVGARGPVCGGSIVRFDPVKLLYKDTVISNTSDCTLNKNDLHRPEGLGFDPKGNLYVTSFRANPADNDRILIISKKDLKESGDKKADISLLLDRIDLWKVADGGPRAFAQTLLFGPDGHLFAPVHLRDLTTGRPLGGEVRRYNLETKAFWTFVSAAGRNLLLPEYMTFGKTNPATLAYDDDEK